MRVKAQSGPLENDGTEQTEDVRYDGAKNSLMMARDYRLQYRCTFYFFQYPFDKQECDGTILLPWKNNYTVALSTGRNPITILGEKGDEVVAGGFSFSFRFQEIKLWPPSGVTR